MSSSLSMTGVFFYGNIKLEDREAVLEDAIEQLKESDLDHVDFNYFWDSAGSDSDDISSLTFKETIGVLKEVVYNFFKAVATLDVCEFIIPYGTMYVTGGDSWGDDPTDAYGPFTKFNQLPDSLLNKAQIGFNKSSLDLFMADYKDKLPEKLKEQLELFKGAIRI